MLYWPTPVSVVVQSKQLLDAPPVAVQPEYANADDGVKVLAARSVCVKLPWPIKTLQLVAMCMFV